MSAFHRLPLLFVVLCCAAAATAGDVTFQVPVGGSIDFNLGVSVGEVSLCTYSVQGTAVNSLFDCDGIADAAGSGIFVAFDDEGTGQPAPAVTAVFFPGAVDVTSSLIVLDPSWWHVLDDGVARISAGVVIQDSMIDCVLTSAGSMTIPSGTIAVRLVYEPATPTTPSTWSAIKGIYR